MSEEFFEISVLRAEGFSDQSGSIGCYVQIDGRLHDVITPLNADNQDSEVLVPFKGLLRLIVKNMGCASEVLGSVSLDIQILPAEGFQWLPLSSNMAKDQIFQLPEEVEKSKILILINPKKDETIFSIEKNLDLGLVSMIKNEISKPEKKMITKVNTTSDSIKANKAKTEQIELPKNKNTNSESIKPANSSNNCNGPTTTANPMEGNWGLIELVKAENERLKTAVQRYKILIEDMAKEINSVKILAQEERKARNEVEDKVDRIAKEYEENLKRAKAREDGLLKMLQERDEDLAEQNRVICQLKSTIRNIEHEKMQIMDAIAEYKTELTLSNFDRLNKELTLVKTLLEDSEAQRHKLQALIQEMPETPSKLSNFLSPISLKSLEFDVSEDIRENKELGIMLEDFTRYKTNLSNVEKDKVTGFNGNVLNIKSQNGQESLNLVREQELKYHKRRATTGFIKVFKENSRK